MTAPLEILEYCNTPMGILCLRRRELLGRPGTMVTEVTLDHEFLMSSYHTDSERALASKAIEWCGGAELDVLVGGLGLGYTAKAALDAPSVQRVEVFELLPEVLGWLEKGWLPLSVALQAEPRLLLRQADVFVHLASPAPTRRFDAVLLDVDHSPDELLTHGPRDFYTHAGLARAREHLADDGVLAVWSSAESEDFERALGEVFSDVAVERIEWMNEMIDKEQEDVLFMARR